MNDHTLEGPEWRAQWLSDVWFGLGWSRHVPAAWVAIISPLVTDGPLPASELEEAMRMQGADHGWESPAWEPLHLYTDEELASLNESFIGTPFAVDEGEPQTAAEVMAEEAELRRRHLATMDIQSQALGVPPVRTLGHLLRFLLACGVLRRTTSRHEDEIDLVATAPLPTEVLVLSEDARREEDAARWEKLHERTAQAVIRQFNPDDNQPLDVLETTLEKLGRRTEADPESVREAVQSLVHHGDFTTNVDIGRAEPHRVFELRVDWQRFRATRFGVRIHHAAGGDDPD